MRTDRIRYLLLVVWASAVVLSSATVSGSVQKPGALRGDHGEGEGKELHPLGHWSSGRRAMVEVEPAPAGIRHLRSQSNDVLELDKGGGQDVCISLLAFENASWIEELLTNIDTFSESSTKVALHLNSDSVYTDAEIANWESKRVTVTPERIPVKAFKGSILTAHLYNVQQLHKKWGNKCGWFVIQHSNMFWVRQGMEQEVRARHYAQLHIFPTADPKLSPLGIYDKMVTMGRDTHLWGQPEGAFFPMKTGLDLYSFLDKWLKDINRDWTYMIKYQFYLEEYLLQTFAYNMDDPPPPEEASDRSSGPLCYRYIGGPKDVDSVQLEDVKAIAKGAKKWEGVYSVKRVNRDANHPITKYILRMKR